MSRPGGRPWARLRAQVYARYGRTCCFCGHGDADQVHHVVPVSISPSLAWVASNLRPIHGRKCAVCGIGCNAAQPNGRTDGRSPKPWRPAPRRAAYPASGRPW